MIAKFKYLIVLLFLYSCAQEDKELSFPPSLFKSPQVVKLDTVDGYVVNQFTGDSIQPLTVKRNDTVKTGKAIPVKGRVMKADTFFTLDSRPLKSSIIKDLNSESKGSIVDPKIVPLRSDSLIYAPFEVFKEPNKDHYGINQLGDTIPTGVPIPIQGKVTKAIQTKSQPALPPQFKDVTIDNIQYIDVDQGLQTSYVFAMLEDSRGDLWFGYDAGGISRYDGKSFTHYSKFEGLHDDYINVLYEDSKGNIWFGTFYGGLGCYNGKEFISFSPEDGLLNSFVGSITEDSLGNIWFAGFNGVSKYDGEYITHFTVKEGLSNEKVSGLLFDDDGNLWIGTLGGLNKFDGKGFTRYSSKSGLSSDAIASLLQDREGNIWIATFDGHVNKFDGTSFIQYERPNSIEVEDLVPQFQDSQGNIWFGSGGAGLSRFDGERFEVYTTEDGLTNNFVRCIIEDNSGKIWVSTDGGGINRLDPNSFSLYTESNGLGNSYCTSIIEDKEGKLWVSTFNSGVSVFNGEDFQQITHKEGFVESRVWDAVTAQNGELWFATFSQGLVRFDGKEFTSYFEEKDMVYNYVLSILEDSKGNIWFGTSGDGIYVYNGETYTKFNSSNGLIDNYILTIIEDKEGNIWFGTHGGGATKYDGTSLVHYTEKEGLSNNIVWSIIEDDEGILWFGTKGGGVNRFDGEKFIYFTENQGLSNNTVWSLIEDNDHTIWVGTESGLNELRRNDGVSSDVDIASFNYSINALSKNDGLKGLDFITNSVCLDSEGVMWWGSGKGLTSLNLADREISDYLPSLSMKSIEINEEFIDFRNAPDSLKEQMGYDSVMSFYNYPLGLELPFDKNHLTFYFSAIDWSSPHKLKYSYQIDGSQDGWSKASPEGKAEYRNLSHGTHTFRVRAIGESQRWSEAFEYTFTILPPWYHTWWARVAYLLIGILLIWGYVRWRTASLKERQLQLEYEVNEATKEISAQKVEAEKQRDVIEEAHNEIKDSIQYAKRIQSAILPPSNRMRNYLPNSFVLYEPKDVVAGDFYWLEKREGKVLFAAADCTGHGVPGAMVSVICNNGLNRSVREHGISEPAKILDKTREIVVEEFEKSEEEVNDGMDIALCALKGNELEYAAAHNPLWIIRKGKISESELGDSEQIKVQEFEAYSLAEIKADKQPIGKYDQTKPYTNHRFTLKDGDRIYVFSDGLADQFGGQLGKKLKSINVKRFLISIQDQDMATQGSSLNRHFNEWKGELEQVDDVCFIGVQV